MEANLKHMVGRVPGINAEYIIDRLINYTRFPLEHLQKLDLRNNNICAPQLQMLADKFLLNNPTIKFLYLGNNHLCCEFIYGAERYRADYGMISLFGAISTMGALKHLDIHCTDLWVLQRDEQRQNSETFLEHARSLKTLQSLNVSANGLNGRVICELLQIGLKELDVSDNPLCSRPGNDICTMPTDNFATELTSLNISYCDLGSQGFEWLGNALRHNGTITALNISNNFGGFGQNGHQDLDGLRAMGFAVQSMKLIRLEIEDNSMFASGGALFTSFLKNNHTLKVLRLNANDLGLQPCSRSESQQPDRLLQFDRSSFEHIIEHLCTMRHLESLNMVKNYIDGNQALAMTTTMFRKIPTLKSLCGNTGKEKTLRKGQVSVSYAIMLAHEIKKNPHLTDLFVNGNYGHCVPPEVLPDGWSGPNALGQYLYEDHPTNSCPPGTKPQGTLALAHALKDKNAITDLNLHHRIDNGDIIAISGAIALSKAILCKSKKRRFDRYTVNGRCAYRRWSGYTRDLKAFWIVTKRGTTLRAAHAHRDEHPSTDQDARGKFNNLPRATIRHIRDYL